MKTTKDIEEEYGVEFEKDMPISDYLKEQGLPSMAEAFEELEKE